MVNDDEFIKIVTSSKSMAEASAKLDMNFNTFKRKAIKLNCYNPNQCGKGLKKSKSTRYKTEDILAGKYPQYNTNHLKQRLIEEGYFEDKCYQCGWNKKYEGSKYSACELHHIDGNSHNHRLDNLTIICPNCHSLTPNYGFRKRAHK